MKGARCGILQEMDGKTPHRKAAVAIGIINAGGDDCWMPVKVPVCPDHWENVQEPEKAVLLDRDWYRLHQANEKREINEHRARRGLEALP